MAVGAPSRAVKYIHDHVVVQDSLEYSVCGHGGPFAISSL